MLVVFLDLQITRPIEVYFLQMIHKTNTRARAYEWNYEWYNTKYSKYYCLFVQVDMLSTNNWQMTSCLTSSFKSIEVRCILRQNGNIILTFPYTLFHFLLDESDLQPNKAVEAHQASF